MAYSTVKKIGDVLHWEYAKLLSDDTSPVVRNFLELKSGTRRCTAAVFEDLDLGPARCAYCSNQEDLSPDTLVPDRGCIGSEAHNTVQVCRGCKAAKGDQDLLDWWGIDRLNELHPVVRRKYLRMLYLCHECRGLLGHDVRHGSPDLSDLAQVFKQPCFSFLSKTARDAARLE